MREKLLLLDCHVVLTQHKRVTDAQTDKSMDTRGGGVSSFTTLQRGCCGSVTTPQGGENIRKHDVVAAKLDEHNVPQRRQRWIESQPQAT